jgi:hypothetical protein
VFKPLNLSAQQKQPLKFKAKLAEDFMGAGSKGQTVDVELDLFGVGHAWVGDTRHAARVLLGRPMSEQQMEALREAHEKQEAAAAAE